ncbi:rbr-type e3 ubiquitin transferase [Anaeramoeba flamelloides]|uniref:RBR-type E3 ubiquitin transferase n=1 Tax=Anaeramoeba flamelloides TaxID=1746091 RepID=A0AAV7YXD3_9EUKA|nr:rbr-type e3 ubiquitin transferase [Anaeramoeba flamelloides]
MTLVQPQIHHDKNRELLRRELIDFQTCNKKEEIKGYDLDQLNRWPQIVGLIFKNNVQSYFNAYLEFINEIMTELNVNFGVAEILCLYFKGDLKRILCEYTKHRKRTMRKAKFNHFFIQESSKDYLGKSLSCIICLKKNPTKKRHSLACRHYCCASCWNSYLESNLKQGKVACIQCMNYQCTRRVNDHFLAKVISPQLFYRYKLRLVKSYISNHKDYSICPSTVCGNLCSRKKNILFGTDAVCECGHRFCFDCHAESHSPSSCKEVKNWEEQKNVNSETIDWLLKHTKPCPNCKNLIEKNGGCNHMTCRKEGNGCGHQFCWVCLKDWKVHGTNYYECKFFDATLHDKMKKEKSEQDFGSLLEPMKNFEKFQDQISLIKKLLSQSKIDSQESNKKITKTKTKTKIKTTTIKTASKTTTTRKTKITTTTISKTDQSLDTKNSSECQKRVLENLLVAYTLLKWNIVYHYYNKHNDKKKEFIIALKEKLSKLEENSENLFNLLQSKNLSKKLSELSDLNSNLYSQTIDLCSLFH